MKFSLSRHLSTYAFDVTPGPSLAADVANTQGIATAVIYTKTAGDVTLVTAEGQTISFTDVPAYTEIHIVAKAVTAATASCVALCIKS